MAAGYFTPRRRARRRRAGRGEGPRASTASGLDRRRSQLCWPPARSPCASAAGLTRWRGRRRRLGRIRRRKTTPGSTAPRLGSRGGDGAARISVAGGFRSTAAGATSRPAGSIVAARSTSGSATPSARWRGRGRHRPGLGERAPRCRRGTGLALPGAWHGTRADSIRRPRRRRSSPPSWPACSPATRRGPCRLTPPACAGWMRARLPEPSKSVRAIRWAGWTAAPRCSRPVGQAVQRPRFMASTGRPGGLFDHALRQRAPVPGGRAAPLQGDEEVVRLQGGGSAAGYRRALPQRVVEQAAGTTVDAINRGRCGQGLAEPAEQRGAAVQPHQRIARTDLEGSGERRRIQPAQAGGVDLQGPRRVAREQAGHEGVKAGDTEAFGSSQHESRARLQVAPVRSRAGIEEHAHQGQVDLRPRPPGGIGVAEPLVERAATIDPAGLEVAPAAVERNLQRRIAAARHRRDFSRGAVEPGVVDDEFGRAAFACPRQQ